MRTVQKLRLKKVLCLVVTWTSGLCWSADLPAGTTAGEIKRLEFGVFWPPRDPAKTPAPQARPLLNGCVSIRPERSPDRIVAMHLTVTLSRPSEEAGREFWNSRLAFPEYDWMRYVRVWDADNRWLWPNLAYLLRLHGVERVERYGGVDPGKGVDNDFAAVLIRKYDSSGTNEDDETKRTPLVAAEWYPVGVSGAVDKQTVVHTAQSDEFTLHPGPADHEPQGLAAVWIIYADFMEAKVPDSWPKAAEFAGGILAYFEVQWDLKAQPGQEVRVRQLMPKSGTGFDWEEWAPRTRAARDPDVTPKLSDVARSSSVRPKSAPSRQAEPGGTANRSQPIQPGTNQTSAAAGSGR